MAFVDRTQNLYPIFGSYVKSKNKSSLKSEKTNNFSNNGNIKALGEYFEELDKYASKRLENNQNLFELMDEDAFDILENFDKDNDNTGLDKFVPSYAVSDELKKEEKDAKKSKFVEDNKFTVSEYAEAVIMLGAAKEAKIYNPVAEEKEFNEIVDGICDLYAYFEE